MRRRHALAGAALTLALRAPSRGFARPQPATHALLIGIDAYGVWPLQGCVNDVSLIEKTVAPLAASCIVLRDAQATRPGVDAAWADVTARCRDGDQLFLSFSGHGNRVPREGGAAEDWDNFIVLQGYDIVRAPHDMLLDNEIEQRFAALGRRGVSVVFVADCCHSGLLTRGIDPDAVTQHAIRTQAGAYKLSMLAQAMAGAPQSPARPAELEHVHFFAACQPDEEVPEIRWQGAKHGALSVAIATGLAGAADADRDGRVTAQELALYVTRTVRGTADVRQVPEVKLGALAPALLTRLGPAAADRPAPAAPTARVRLRIDGAAPAFMPALEGVDLVTAGEFDLLWRRAKGQTVSALGDVIADEGVTADLLPASIERFRALARVQALVARHAMELRLERVRGGDGGETAVHVPGTVLRLVSDALAQENLVIFNIAGDGTVQLLYPSPDRPGEQPLVWNRRVEIDDIDVRPPFGTDRPVAVASDQRLEPLAAALRRLHEQREPRAAVDAVERAIEGSRWQAGLAGLFTKAN